MGRKPELQSIFSPALFHLYEEGLTEKIVVVIDILRATTTMVLAFENGAIEIVPVGIPEEALYYKDKDFLVAAERGGETVEGFSLGNSPQDYTKKMVKGRRIAITTTNGTNALRLAAYAKKVVVGSFLNLQAVADYLIAEKRDVLLFCAGWKDRCNLEDTVYAGALAELLQKEFTLEDDSTQMALDLWKSAKKDLKSYMAKASHSQRFKTLHIEGDLDMCLKMDTTSLVPLYEHGSITVKSAAPLS